MNDQKQPSSTVAGARKPWLRAVDFAAPSALAPDQQGRLRRMADELGPIVTARALNELGLSMELTPLWMTEHPWREVHPVPADDSVTIEMTSSAGGSFFVALDPTLASLIVERLLDSEPDPARPLRAITTIDRSLLSRVTELLVSCLNQEWEEATGATLTLDAVSSHREVALHVDATEPTQFMAMEVRLFSTYTLMHFLMPQATIRPVALKLSRPSARGNSDDPDVSRAVQARLGEANVDVQVQLGSVRLTAGEIADLHPGDRVSIPTPATEAATLIVDGVPVQFGHIGRSNGHRAVRVGRHVAAP